jgi:succinoglycan biosynthesis transport protein ExoP
MSFASQGARSGGQYTDSELDLSGLGSALWRKKWLILGPTILIGLLTLIVVQVITPRYQSESRVIVEGRDNVYLRPDADKDTMDRTVDQEAVTSQAQLILSRDLANEVINKLKLNQRPEFDPALGPSSLVRSLLAMVGLVRNPMSMTPEERVLEAYYDRLTVYPVDKSRVIVIDFSSEDPDLAAQVTNAIADGYLQLLQKVKQDQAQSATQVLAGQVETLRKKVVEAEGKVEAYRARSNLLVGNNNTTLSAQQLGDMTAQLSAARVQKADAESKSKLIRDMLKSGQPIESSDILNSELIRRLSEQRVTLRAQLAEQSSTLLDNHPRIKELKAQIADLDRQIDNEAATVARSLDNDSKIAGTRVDALQASLDQLKTQAATNNEDDVQLRELERDAKSQRDLLESYLAKYREASARDAVNASPPDARVISRATVSNVPAYPKKLPTVLIAMLTTLIITSGFVLTKELLAAPEVPVVASRARARVAPAARDSEEIAPSRMASAMNVLRKKPRSSSEPVYPVSAIGDVAEDLRHNGSAGRPVAIFGSAQGLDASWTALKFARMLAESDRTILVGIGSADAAIRAASFDAHAVGLADLASGEASFRDIITKDRKTSVHLISSGRTPADRGEILAEPVVEPSFEALSRSYDFVIVAVGEIVGPDLEAVAAIAPRAVLVAGTLTSAGIVAARERLLDAGFEDVTVVAEGKAAGFEPTAAAA